MEVRIILKSVGTKVFDEWIVCIPDMLPVDMDKTIRTGLRMRKKERT